MAYPLTETGKLARRYGISYACAKYRLARGIPLDAPKRRNNNAKAWQTRQRAVGPKPAKPRSRRMPEWKKALRRAKNPFARMVP